jgi:hypothetical protein
MILYLDLLVKHSECYILEVGDCGNFLVKQYLLRHYIYKISFIFFLILSLAFQSAVDPIGEGEISFLAQGDEVTILILSEDAVHLAVFKVLQGLDKQDGF